MINNGTIRNRLGEQVWAMLLAILMTVLLGQAATANVLTPVVRPSGLNPSPAAQNSPEPALIPALAEWAKQLQAAAPTPTAGLSEVQAMAAPDPRWLETLISGVDPALLQPLAWQTTLGGSPAQQPVRAEPAVRARVLEAFGRTPLHFEPNQGQTDPAVKFLARAPGYQLLLTPNEAVLAVRGQTAELPVVVRMQLTGAGVNPQPVVEGLAALPGQSNYYLGNDPQRWQTAVPHFAKVRYGAVYPGVDWELYGNPRQLEYDFVVAPGADPNLINLSFAGADGARLGADGELVVAVAGQEVLHSSPTIYQVVNGERQIVTGGYVLRESVGDAPVVGFEIAAYDRDLPLVIDPLVYFTYLGGTGNDFAGGIAVDAAGNAYLTGYTASTNFNAPALNTNSGLEDAFVTKLDTTGAISYSAYLGGIGDDHGNAIAVSSSGNVYLTGYTESNNFPVLNPYQSTLNGTRDAFLTQFNSNGVVIYSTYLGGSLIEEGNGIAVDSSGIAYLAGYTTSTNFPTKGAYAISPNGLEDAFVAKLNPAVAGVPGLVYGSYLGGNANDRAQGIALDSSNRMYVAGYSSSPNFPVTTRAYTAGEDAFVTMLDSSGVSIVYSTLIGGSADDRAQGIAVNSTNNAFVTGFTSSAFVAGVTFGFPTTTNAYQRVRNGTQDAFVLKLTAVNGILDYSTYLGSTVNADSSTSAAYGIAVNSSGYAVVTGLTSSASFPQVHPDAVFVAADEAFISMLSPTGSSLSYSTYWGGAGNQSGRGVALLGSPSNIYVAGDTNSNFGAPTTGLRAYSALIDAFAVKISPTLNYELTWQIQGSGTGTVTPSPAGIACGAATTDCRSYLAGTSVTLTAAATTGSFTGWSGACTGAALTCTITMDAVKMVVATFTNIASFNLTVQLSGLGSGSVVSVPQGINCVTGANPIDCVKAYPTGASVTLTAAPASGSTFVGWAGTAADAGTCAGTVTQTCVVSMTAAKTVVAIFNPANSLAVVKAGTGSGTVTSSPAGIDCGPTCPTQTSAFPTGTVVTLTATVQAGSTFTGWSGSTCAVITSTTCQITVGGAAQSVTATFTASTYVLTVSKAGAGAAISTVTSSPPGINCGLDCTESYAQNTLVMLTATAGTGFTFTGWTAGTCTGTDPCAVTMDAAQSVTATFLPNRTLAVTKSGNGTGTVTSLPVGIACGTDCTETYAPGTLVTLTAAAGVNSAFVGWSGACSGTGTCTLTMDKAESVDAQFNITNELSVTVLGAGRVFSIPDGIDCGTACTQVYAPNTQVTLTATALSNSKFAGWADACASFGTTPVCTVTISAARSVTAYFSLTQTLSVSKAGNADGSVKSSPVGIDCGATCSALYFRSTLVTLTATPTGSATFAGWNGACTGTGACTVLLDGDKNVTATFTVPLQSFSLTVVKSGDGTGTVISTPNGITCGAVCLASYEEDTEVSLTAAPGAGSAFAGWTGACSGTGACTVTMSANQSVTASFTKIDTNLPDLEIPNLTSPGLSANGQRNVSFALTVKNKGAKVAGAFQVGLYFTRDNTVDPAIDLNAGKVCSFTGLAVGATAGCSGNIVLPASLPAAGGYYLGAYADPQGNIKELRKDNNAAVTDTINGVPTPKTFTVYQLTTVVNKLGNGTVYSQPSGIACSIKTNCQMSLLAGDQVTLTATPASGFVFAGWSGACSGTGACKVAMSANRTVTANFSTKKAQTIGLYNPAVARFYLRNSNSAGASNITFSYGPANQGWLPLVGDWDGNGTQTIGLYNPATARFYLRNSNSKGAADLTFFYGPANAGWKPLIGDWNGPAF